MEPDSLELLPHGIAQGFLVLLLRAVRREIGKGKKAHRGVSDFSIGGPSPGSGKDEWQDKKDKYL
jgi:hypothetical protein